MASLCLSSPNPFSSYSLASSPTEKKKHYAMVSCHTSDSSQLRESAAATKPSSRSHQVVLSSCAEKKTLIPTASSTLDSDQGIGIVRFLRGKRLLVTGATGFLGKVLVEKILRTTPDVGKIYVLIKAKDKEAAMSRMKSEIVDAELFETLQEAHGKSYQAFMLGKLTPVVGDMGEARMGIEAELAQEISEEVDVIVNSAANTTFHESYDVALNINTMGTYRLMSFAKKVKRLELLVHVSTAYANGRRQGRILEKPFCIGDTIANEKIFFSAGSSVKPMPRLDIETEFKLAFASGQTDQVLKDLGLSRAWMHGWQDTYSLTKAMGEMVINCMSGDFPVVVVRPSIIGSISREPSPGWIQGNRMLDPIILSYGKGQLTSFPYDANEVADCIPVDMVANAMLAAMAKHGQKMDNGIHVYHTCSSTVNPLTFRDMMRFLFEYFATSPWIDSEGKAIPVSEMKEFSDLDEFSSYIQTQAKVPSNSAWNESSQRKILMKLIKQVQNMARIYEPYTFCRGRFDNTNTQALIEEMSEEEKLNFNFDVRSISWEDYFKNVHILGLRKHVMKGRGM